MPPILRTSYEVDVTLELEAIEKLDLGAEAETTHLVESSLKLSPAHVFTVNVGVLILEPAEELE